MSINAARIERDIMNEQYPDKKWVICKIKWDLDIQPEDVAKRHNWEIIE